MKITTTTKISSGRDYTSARSVRIAAERILRIAERAESGRHAVTIRLEAKAPRNFTGGESYIRGTVTTVELP